MNDTRIDVGEADIPETCSHCGRFGHTNTRAAPCTLPPVPWDRIGIEIEGFWRSLDSMQRMMTQADRRECQVVGDASLNTEGGPTCDCSDPECPDGILSPTREGWRAREIRTNPGNPTQVLKQLVALYPNGVNRSAGMHVHVSWKHGADILLLKEPAFFEYWAARWEAWGKRVLKPQSYFFERLAGLNSYCRKNEPDCFCERYSQINFDCAYDSHFTTECRLLPMFVQAKIAVSAVRELLNIYDSWLTGNLAVAPGIWPSVTLTDAELAVEPVVVDDEHELPLSAINLDEYVTTVSDVIETYRTEPSEEGMVLMPPAEAYAEMINQRDRGDRGSLVDVPGPL